MLPMFGNSSPRRSRLAAITFVRRACVSLACAGLLIAGVPLLASSSSAAESQQRAASTNNSAANAVSISFVNRDAHTVGMSKTRNVASLSHSNTAGQASNGTRAPAEGPIKFAPSKRKKLEVSRPETPVLVARRLPDARVPGATPHSATQNWGAAPATHAATPVDAASYLRVREPSVARQVNFQSEPPAAEEAARDEAAFQADIAKNPCAAMPVKPYSDYGIGIAMPAGEFPADFATSCWTSINESAGPLAGMRARGTSAFAWDATCLCHRPLYFEEVNLERYGYGCCETLQPAASAAHFFGTIPVLPYCMAVDCPCECIYTLGNYRPGSCPPRRCTWPPLSPRAILAEGGVWTGMVFLIP